MVSSRTAWSPRRSLHRGDMALRCDLSLTRNVLYLSEIVCPTNKLLYMFMRSLNVVSKVPKRNRLQTMSALAKQKQPGFVARRRTRSPTHHRRPSIALMLHSSSAGASGEKCFPSLHRMPAPCSAVGWLWRMRWGWPAPMAAKPPQVIDGSCTTTKLASAIRISA